MTMVVKVTRDAQPTRSYFGEPFHPDRAGECCRSCAPSRVPDPPAVRPRGWVGGVCRAGQAILTGLHLHAVLTAPPRILQANVSAGRLWLQWAVPLAELAQHMVYQVRYATDSSQDWKVPGTGPLSCGTQLDMLGVSLGPAPPNTLHSCWERP